MSVQNSFSAKDVGAAILIAAMIQFINVMDFMMVMPLGPDFSKALGIPLNAMGEVGGVYTFSAAIVGFAAALFIDRFARKTAILACMAGLIVATFLGGFVWNEASMIATRMLAGAFGGPLSSLSLALVADISTPQTRGSAMGKVMGGFAVASVFGVPFGLELAEHFTWRAPFISTACMGVAILAVASFKLPYYTSSSVGQKLPQLLTSLVTMMSSRLPLMAYAMISLAMMAGS